MLPLRYGSSLFAFSEDGQVLPRHWSVYTRLMTPSDDLSLCFSCIELTSYCTLELSKLSVTILVLLLMVAR